MRRNAADLYRCLLSRQRRKPPGAGGWLRRRLPLELPGCAGRFACAFTSILDALDLDAGGAGHGRLWRAGQLRGRPSALLVAGGWRRYGVVPPHSKARRQSAKRRNRGHVDCVRWFLCAALGRNRYFRALCLDRVACAVLPWRIAVLPKAARAILDTGGLPGGARPFDAPGWTSAAIDCLIRSAHLIRLAWRSAALKM